MKVAYFSESSADEAALKILTEAILGRQTESVIHAGLRHRGWPSVKNALPAVLKQLHYHTDAEGFVLVVDSNGSSTHSQAHEQPNARDPLCRLCQLRRIVEEVQQQVSARPHLPPLRIAIGIAIPAIEAWLLCGVNSHVTEAAWINGMKENQFPYTKPELKNQAYGTSHPTLEIETAAMTAAATRLATNFSTLENLFPNGFGHLASELRNWRCIN